MNSNALSLCCVFTIPIFMSERAQRMDSSYNSTFSSNNSFAYRFPYCMSENRDKSPLFESWIEKSFLSRLGK